MVVMKLVVKEPSEKRKRRQLLPTPGTFTKRVHEREREIWEDNAENFSVIHKLEHSEIATAINTKNIRSICSRTGLHEQS